MSAEPVQAPAPFSNLGKQLQAYFEASAEDVRGYLQAVGVEESTDTISCQDLCVSSLTHISDTMGWPLPPERGHQCAEWKPEPSSPTGLTCSEWVPLSETYMEQVARSMDPTQDASQRQFQASGTFQPDLRIEEARGASNLIMPEVASIPYTPDEMAVRVAQLFNVFPSALHLGAGGGLLQRDDPKFGPQVGTSRYREWRRIVAESQAWVRTALSKLPTSPQIVRLWFGTDPSTPAAVRKTLTGMTKTLDALMIKVGKPPSCSSGSTTLAYVTQFSRSGAFAGSEEEQGRKVINVCDRFWQDEFISQAESKFGTIVHEAAHHHGAGDEPYKGASPYGRAQCLRMAAEAPAHALSNADNYKWLVFYLNRCTGRRPSAAEAPPSCELVLEPQAGGQARILRRCEKETVGNTIKFMNKKGHYVQHAVNYGKLGADKPGVSSNLGTQKVARGTFVKLFFEVDCVLWEAAVEWQGKQVGAKAERLLDFRDPKSKPPEPATPSQCAAAVSGAEQRENLLVRFLSKNNCKCPKDHKVAGAAAECAASERQFAPGTLQGKGCRCQKLK